jgi:EAL domain-containing protein (putative c-di-GMP-specific phosphodiesterase class I)
MMNDQGEYLELHAYGVETPAQLAMVRAKGCHEAQGYVFSPPISAGQTLDAFSENAVKRGRKYQAA